MLSEVKRSLSVMVGVMAACSVFPPSVSYFLAISIVGMVKGQLLLLVCNVRVCVPVNITRIFKN